MSFQDPGQFNEQELKLGLWFTKNRLIIKAVLLSVGFLVSGIVIFYNITFFVNFYTGGELDRIQEDILSRSVWQDINRSNYEPLDLNWGQVEVIKRPAGDTADLVVWVVNKNQKWYMSKLTYYFVLPGWKSENMETYILPGQTKVLVLPNVDLENIFINPTEDILARVVVESQDWNRIKSTDFFAGGNLIDLGLSASEARVKKITPAVTQFDFILENNSDYNYSQAEVALVLSSGAQKVAASFFVVEDLPSGQTKPVSWRFFGEMPLPTSWEINLSTNLLDSKNLLKFTIDQF